MALKLRDIDIQRASDTQHLDPKVAEFTDAFALDLYARRQILQRGYTFQTKKIRKGLLYRWSKFTTVTPGTIWLGANWDQKTHIEQVPIVVHELVHVLQIEKVGFFRFAWAYTFNVRKRWAVEMQALRQQITCMARLGVPQHVILRKIEGQWETYRTGYLMKNIDSDDLRRVTTELLQQWYGEVA